MKTKRNLYCLFVPLLLLSACVVTQIPDIQPTQTLLPTSIPVTETAGSDMNRIITTPTHVPGPIVAQIGDLTMEVYEFAMFQPRPDEGRTFNTTAGPSSEILKNRRPLRDVFAQPFSPPPVNGRQLTAAEKFVDEKMLVVVKLDDEEVLSIDCGDPGPVNNLRGT